MIDRQSFAPDEIEEVPQIVRACAERIDSPFFSVDVIRRRDGELRVVEIGDGQVSDLVGWTAERFAQVWSLARNNRQASSPN